MISHNKKKIDRQKSAFAFHSTHRRRKVLKSITLDKITFPAKIIFVQVDLTCNNYHKNENSVNIYIEKKKIKTWIRTKRKKILMLVFVLSCSFLLAAKQTQCAINSKIRPTSSYPKFNQILPLVFLLRTFPLIYALAAIFLPHGATIQLSPVQPSIIEFRITKGRLKSVKFSYTRIMLQLNQKNVFLRSF